VTEIVPAEDRRVWRGVHAVLRAAGDRGDAEPGDRRAAVRGAAGDGGGAV